MKFPAIGVLNGE